MRLRLQKHHVDDLALFGGQPLFQRTLHVGRPNQGSRHQFLSRIEAILDRNWLTNNGPAVQEFERRIAAHLDVRHCVVVCSGTMALELAAQAMNLSGEVIVPGFTFIATAHAFTWQGIRPRRYFWPCCHRMEPYRSDSTLRKGSLEHTEAVAEEVHQLPSGSEVSEEDVSMISDFLHFVQERAPSTLGRKPPSHVGPPWEPSS